MPILSAELLTAHARREGVPDGLIVGLVRYVTHGYRPGHFLRAVLENNLMDAMARADFDSRLALHGICVFIYNDLPAKAHGSPARVDQWIALGGLRQFEQKESA